MLHSAFAYSVISAAIVCSAAAVIAPPLPPQDNQTACNGPGRNNGSTLHVQVHDQFGLYRAGETVMVSDAAGMPLVTINCSGPYANFQLEPGHYRVVGFIGAERSDEIAVNVPPKGATVMLVLHESPGANPGDEVF
jgi:hypothetical protein